MSKQKSLLNRKTIWISLAAVLLAGGLLFSFFKLREKPVEVTTEKVSIKEVVHIVTATGKIEPALVVAMSPDVSGEIIELPIRDGQSVEKGELLFKIQPDLYVNQVEQSLAQLNSAKSQSMETRARKLKAEDDFHKASLLYKEKLISESDYITSRTNAQAAQAAYQASIYTIAQNKSLLDQNQDRMNKTVVRAPINGTIIALNSKPGERVVGTGQFPGTEVLRLANLDSMQVEVEVNENDIVNVKTGNPVSITVDAYGDRIFRGVVHEISNSAISQAAGTQDEVTNFSVKIRIFNHDRMLKPGMSATADIESVRIKNALVVPIQSVTIRDVSGNTANKKAQKSDIKITTTSKEPESRQGVFVVKSGRVSFRRVKTGTTDNTHIIVTAGLSKGEEVVSGSYTAITSQLKEGSKVKQQQK
ncbi:efflux RND transporter periplasmic adaptor subunit [Pelodictyon phaeoclathratiforme]|jgi:HlyD family secretion protein|uniref:Efflux transporter, RND family, MFP subunit n=1 Tax=Pelodictyon phaeoclathratiforme (strain DSM 5477 / BU-1) TaxID=324925 RepID=B4SAI5_PELPB|nr:efflux RND transporter periplasmic adaptor subunit [Pelodictyon phaeoclathratiforme]ACF43871.1 efflux transporter, RND family, MFP subunit [Pelodictyon phaeoclathratiforme BU-1]MBV5288448.1 efflux RND transporter periplasmic adaptor subunit [Pelodictyon phaeoclathratiforme]